MMRAFRLGAAAGLLITIGWYTAEWISGCIGRALGTGAAGRWLR